MVDVFHLELTWFRDKLQFYTVCDEQFETWSTFIQKGRKLQSSFLLHHLFMLNNQNKFRTLFESYD